MTGRPARAPVLLALVWLAGVAVATSVGLLAVRLVAAQVGDPAVAPLSAAAAATAAPASSPAGTAGTPAAPPPAPTSAPTTAAPAPPAPTAAGPAPVTRAFSSSGGELGVQCVGTALHLLYTAPAGGYAIDERSVAGSDAEVRFEGAGTRVRLRVSCASGQPRLVEQRTDPDGGGGGGDDRGGGGDDRGGGGGGDDRGGDDRGGDDRGGDDRGGDDGGGDD